MGCYLVVGGKSDQAYYLCMFFTIFYYPPNDNEDIITDSTKSQTKTCLGEPD